LAKYDGPEKRYIRRHHITCLSVVYRRKKFFGSAMTAFSPRCELSDVNWRGARFYARDKMRKGSHIEILFEYPLDVEEAAEVPVRAKVVWQEWSTRHRAWRTGVQFVDLVDGVKNAILRIIDGSSKHDQKFRYEEQEIA